MQDRKIVKGNGIPYQLTPPIPESSMKIEIEDEDKNIRR